MLNIKSIRHNPQWYKDKLSSRGYKPKTIDLLLSYDRNWRSMIEKNEKIKQQRNEVSKRIGKKKSLGENARQLIEDMKTVSASIKENDEQIKFIETDIHNLIMSLPNIPHDSVPNGKALQECIVSSWSPTISSSSVEEFKTFWEIGKSLNIIDYNRAERVAGRGFIYYLNQGARLKRAVTNYVFDKYAEREEFEEIIPPYFINESANIPLSIPKSDNRAMDIKQKNLALVTRASALLLSLYSDLIIEEKEVPQYLIASVPCFQSNNSLDTTNEKDTAFLTQTDIIELLVLSKPGTSFEQLEKWTDITQMILKDLNLSHRTINLPTENLNFSASKTYDIEVWLPGQKCYKKLTSCTNSLEFLTRRFNIRYRSRSGQVSFMHSLNGFGFKVDVILAAILESYQQEDNTVKIPKVLLPYMNGACNIQNQEKLHESYSS